MPDRDELLVERDGHVLRCTINREERRNALSAGVAAQLVQAFKDADMDPTIRVIVVTAVGEKVFCAGGDLAADFSGGGMEKGVNAFYDLVTTKDNLGTPLVARVNGHCMGGGLGLMLGCDMAIAADDVKFATPEVKIGLFPMMIAPLVLRNAGPKRGMEMILTGRKIDAKEAESIGLINKAVPRGELDNAVNEAVELILNNSPSAISMGRKALAHVRTLPVQEATEYLGKQLLEVIKTEDASEGIQAFFQKRKPEWKGR
jgi:enoyl-CoA hydratase/carnithine racemase